MIARGRFQNEESQVPLDPYTPLLILGTADSLDSRWLAQHPHTLIRRHSGSKLTARDRRLRLNPARFEARARV